MAQPELEMQFIILHAQQGVRNPGPIRHLLDPSAPRLTPRHEESRLIIATSYGSYVSRVENLWPNARWARVTRDECHLEKSPGTINVRIIGGIVRKGPPPLNSFMWMSEFENRANY